MPRCPSCEARVAAGHPCLSRMQRAHRQTQRENRKKQSSIIPKNIVLLIAGSGGVVICVGVVLFVAMAFQSVLQGPGLVPAECRPKTISNRWVWPCTTTIQAS